MVAACCEGVAAVSVVLAVILWVLGVVLGLLVLLVSAILLLPLDLAARLDARLREDEASEWGYGGCARWAGQVRWGWRVLGLAVQGEGAHVNHAAVSILGRRLRSRSRPKEAEAAKAEPAKQRKRRKRRLTLDDLRSYLREGWRLVRRLLADLRLRLEGDLLFGLPDPSLTGSILAVLSVTGTPGRLRVQPMWLESGAEGWVTLTGRIYGFEILAALWPAYWHSAAGQRRLARIKSTFKRPKRFVGGRTA